MTADIAQWQGVGPPPIPGGEGPPCDRCGVSTWVELCGGPATDVYRPNIDVFEHENVDVVHDLESGTLPLHDGHAERIKMIHGLNHLSRDAALSILGEAFRALRPGGYIYLMVSDTDFVLERIAEEGLAERWLDCLYHAASQTEAGFHKWAWNWKTIKAALEGAGFVEAAHLGWYNAWEFKCGAFRPEESP